MIILMVNFLDYCENGNLDQVKKILKEFPEQIHVRGCGHSAPLHYVAEYGHLDIVKYLVEEHLVFIDFIDIFKYSALMKASKNGHYEIVEYLVKKGSNRYVNH